METNIRKSPRTAISALFARLDGPTPPRTRAELFEQTAVPPEIGNAFIDVSYNIADHRSKAHDAAIRAGKARAEQQRIDDAANSTAVVVD